MTVICMLQKRLTTAAKKAVSKMPQKTVRRGDAVSVVCLFDFCQFMLCVVFCAIFGLISKWR